MDTTTYRTLDYREDGFCRIVDLVSGKDEEAAAIQFVELGEACERIAWDEGARVVLLAFNGQLQEPSPADSVSGNSSLVEPVSRLKQPVIAAIRGDAFGLGLELALACDLRFGTENARFGFLQIGQGRMPHSGGTQRLPRLIGQSRAMHMILTGELMDSGEASTAGLLHRVVPPGTLMTAAAELARGMAEKSPLSLSYAKEALYSSRDLTLDQGLNMEMDLYLLLFSTSDRTEGITAFKEKRTPKFKGA
jgi:enoyl-CoA hydratase/carnithine racemase